MPLYWLCYRHNNQIFVVIEPGASLIHARLCAGLTIWHNDGRFIYVGMSGRGITAETIRRNAPQGLYTRLKSHASGRRNGDQFCVYVADRLVLPNLTQKEIADTASGRHQMDAFVRRYIHENFSSSMNFASTDKYKVRSVKCCVVYDSKDGTIYHVHRIVTVEGADETSEQRVVERTLELATDLGIDRATVRTLRVDDSALQPGVRYAVDIAKGSLIAIGKSNQKDLLGR